MNKEKILKKVLSNVVDFDMHNLFPSRTPMEEMEDAASGAGEILPKNTLREKNYQDLPLIVLPAYQGDFLDKLRQPDVTGKPVEAADNDNLKDFMMPSEMLKHQEKPCPRDLVDEYYEMNKPGEGVGYEDLKEYNDRSWDSFDAPEISEDKPLRVGPVILEPIKKSPFRSAERVIAAFFKDKKSPDPGIIVASFLLNVHPVELCVDCQSSRVAKVLADFLRSQITTKEKGTREVVPNGVTATLYRAEPRSGRWSFSTRSADSKEFYRTVFQFIPHGTERDVKKLQARVSCTCSSWLFYGAQYNAVLGDYLYGKIRPKFSPPKKKDPNGKFLVCKHVLACIPIVSKYKLGEIPAELRDKMKRAPKFEVSEDVPPEKLRIPSEFISIGKRSKIKDIVDNWEDNPRKRKNWIMGLKDPEEVAYFAHRFPATSTQYVAEKLKLMSKDPGLRREAEKLLEDIKDTRQEAPINIQVPVELSKLDTDTGLQESLKSVENKSKTVKRKFIMSLTDPDKIAYVSYKLYHDPLITSYVIERLDDMKKDTETYMEDARNKAEHWFRTIA